MPQGTARASDPIWWTILDEGGTELASFDHRLFNTIQNGATVTFTDADGDGIAENVQPAATVTRYIARATQGGALNDDQQAQVLYTIMTALQTASGATGAERQQHLRRLRMALDTFHD
jgi:hypothetical protein